MAQSRPFHGEAPSRASTLKSAGIGFVSGLGFLMAGVVLGLLCGQVEPLAGEFSLSALLMRVLVGVVIGASVGATFYVPPLGDLAALGAGVVGAAIGSLLVGALFVTLFTKPFVRRRVP